MKANFWILIFLILLYPKSFIDCKPSKNVSKGNILILLSFVYVDNLCVLVPKHNSLSLIKTKKSPTSKLDSKDTRLTEPKKTKKHEFDVFGFVLSQIRQLRTMAFLNSPLHFKNLFTLPLLPHIGILDRRANYSTLFKQMDSPIVLMKTLVLLKQKEGLKVAAHFLFAYLFSLPHPLFFFNIYYLIFYPLFCSLLMEKFPDVGWLYVKYSYAGVISIVCIYV
jgi:hypothetical protein